MVFAYILLFLFFLFLLRYLISIYLNNEQKEGFIQKEDFLLKTEQNVYDDFYASVYDQIFIPSQRIEKCIAALLKTEPFIENSVFLDIGSGTGMFANTLSENGYNVFGVDKSTDMIRYSEQKYQKVSFIQGDVMVPMQFETNTFTHVCCVDFTIYLFLDKSQLFKNIHSWLTTGGYLCLHLIDPATFDTIIPAGKPFLIDDPHKYIPGKQRILETLVQFEDFQYKSKYEIHPRKWKWTETFTDNKTKHVRQNERSLFMDTAENIIILAEKNGFKKIDVYSDKNYYILKKI
jgi:ubiquinone/menaquinone biosynthesis C-methylase UbiE